MSEVKSDYVTLPTRRQLPSVLIERLLRHFSEEQLIFLCTQIEELLSKSPFGDVVIHFEAGVPRRVANTPWKNMPKS